MAQMKTRYRHIHFEPTVFKGIYSCLTNKGDIELGLVGPGAWGRITFTPGDETEFSADCLDDISHFIGQLEAAGKTGPPMEWIVRKESK